MEEGALGQLLDDAVQVRCPDRGLGDGERLAGVRRVRGVPVGPGGTPCGPGLCLANPSDNGVCELGSWGEGLAEGPVWLCKCIL